VTALIPLAYRIVLAELAVKRAAHKKYCERRYEERLFSPVVESGGN